MGSYRDPYEVLGVSRDASDKEITSAYRKLAKQYHPDLNPGDDIAAKKMSEINAAYDSIKNGTADSYQPHSAYSDNGYGYSGSSPYENYGQTSRQNNGQTYHRTYYYYSSGGDANRHYTTYQRSRSGMPFLVKLFVIYLIIRMVLGFISLLINGVFGLLFRIKRYDPPSNQQYYYQQYDRDDGWNT